VAEKPGPLAADELDTGRGLDSGLLMSVVMLMLLR
jgi:hypothetical protein